MNNVVLSIIKNNGANSLKLGNNEENVASKDLQMNWKKLDKFTSKENQSINSLSGFCRKFFQPALTEMNDGGIARSSVKRIKTPEKLRLVADELKSLILIAIMGIKADKKRILQEELELKLTTFVLNRLIKIQKLKRLIK